MATRAVYSNVRRPGGKHSVRDFVNRLTFGFLMAQLVPGVIVVLSACLLYVSLFSQGATSLFSTFSDIIDLWSGSLRAQIAFVGLSVAAGMTIHGLNWAVLGFLETHYAKGSKPKPAAHTFWHDWRIGLQVLVGPVKMLREVIQLLVQGQSIERVAIEENNPFIPQNKVDQYQSGSISKSSRLLPPFRSILRPHRLRPTHRVHRSTCILSVLRLVAAAGHPFGGRLSALWLFLCNQSSSVPDPFPGRECLAGRSFR